MRVSILIGMAAALMLAGQASANKATDRNAREFIAKYDADGDGRLSPAEFPCPTDKDGKCDDIAQMLTWESYDRNGDGFISLSEFAAQNPRSSTTGASVRDRTAASPGKD